MLFTLLKRSFSNQKKAMTLMFVSVAMGTAVSASLVTLALDIKNKVSKELRSFGANIIIEPKVGGFADIAGQRRYLREEDIVKAKTIFWRHNIVGIAPFLEETVEINYGGKTKNITSIGTWFDKELPLPGEDKTFRTGIYTVSPWWTIEGGAPEKNGVLPGITLAEELGLKTGETVFVDGEARIISGIVSTGGKEDDQIFMDLDALQEMKGRDGKLSRVLVSALTTPMDDFAYKDPTTMSKTEYEKWYCTGYVTSIAKQLEEVFPGSKSKPIWRVAETEGSVLGRLSVLIYLLTGATLLAAAVSVSTTMASSVLRRLDEIGLMKSIGADSLGIIVIFLSEAFIIGLAGGAAGYILSLFVTKSIGMKVFSTSLTGRFMLLPASLISAFLIAAIGSFLPIRRALKVKPVIVLKGGQ